MSAPCTVPRLIRCRVRHLASCFYACRLPLEEEPEIFCSKSPETPSGSIGFDYKRGARGCRKASAKMRIAKNMCKEDEGESVQSSSYKINRNFGEAEPHFSEEDYIVFCFREDGAIHMINEAKSYDEDDENEENTTATTSAAATLQPMSRKGDEKGGGEDRKWLAADEIKQISHDEQSDPSKMDSFESCDSNLSDASTSSFAFPV